MYEVVPEFQTDPWHPPTVHTVQFGAPGLNLDCRHPHLDNLKTGKAFHAQNCGQQGQPNILAQGLC